MECGTHGSYAADSNLIKVIVILISIKYFKLHLEERASFWNLFSDIFFIFEFSKHSKQSLASNLFKQLHAMKKWMNEVSSNKGMNEGRFKQWRNHRQKLQARKEWEDEASIYEENEWMKLQTMKEWKNEASSNVEINEWSFKQWKIESTRKKFVANSHIVISSLYSFT